MASAGWAEIGRFIQLGLIGPAWFYFFRLRKLGIFERGRDMLTGYGSKKKNATIQYNLYFTF
jgi:hypothetical protein